MARKPTELDESDQVEAFLDECYPDALYLQPEHLDELNAWRIKNGYLEAKTSETPAKVSKKSPEKRTPLAKKRPVTEDDLAILRNVFPNISQAQEEEAMEAYRHSDHLGPFMAFMHANPALAIKVGGIGTKCGGSVKDGAANLAPIGAFTTSKARMRGMFLGTIFDARSLGAPWINPEHETLVEEVVALLGATSFNPAALEQLLQPWQIRYLDIGGQFPTDEDEAKRIIYACWEAQTNVVVGYNSLGIQNRWPQRMTRPSAKTGKTERNQCKPVDPSRKTNVPGQGPEKGRSHVLGRGQQLTNRNTIRFVDGEKKKKKKKKRK